MKGEPKALAGSRPIPVVCSILVARPLSQDSTPPPLRAADSNTCVERPSPPHVSGPSSDVRDRGATPVAVALREFEGGTVRGVASRPSGNPTRNPKEPVEGRPAAALGLSREGPSRARKISMFSVGAYIRAG